VSKCIIINFPDDTPNWIVKEKKRKRRKGNVREKREKVDKKKRHKVKKSEKSIGFRGALRETPSY